VSCFLLNIQFVVITFFSNRVYTFPIGVMYYVIIKILKHRKKNTFNFM